MQHFTSFDGLNLAYTDKGRGLPLLCLAGLTRNSTDFDYLAPHLPPLRLIRLDYRGRGASDWSADPMAYSVATEARDVLDLLDHLKIAKAAILGTSRGGLIAMALAATAKARLIGVCLNDIGPVIEQTGIDRIREYVGQTPEFSTRRDMADAMPANMPGFVNVPQSRWQQEVARHTALTPDGLALTYDPKLREAFLAAVNVPAPDLWPIFDAMKDLPLALLRGANSVVLSSETAREMRSRRPDMIYAEVPDRGHIPFLDEPVAVAAINNWLEACE